MYRFETVQGAVNRSIKFTFTDQDGDAIDLSSGAARCTMVKRTSGARIFNQQALASLDSSGNGQYDWASGDLDEKGAYYLEIELSEDGTNYYAIPEIIIIDARGKFAS